MEVEYQPCLLYFQQGFSLPSSKHMFLTLSTSGEERQKSHDSQHHTLKSLLLLLPLGGFKALLMYLKLCLGLHDNKKKLLYESVPVRPCPSEYIIN